MSLISKARITALGAYVPPKKLTNFDLEKQVDTSNEWIIQRTGIMERRITEKNVYASDLAQKAVKDLEQNYKKSLANLDLIVVATITPDFLTPSVAAVVQGALGLKNTVGVLDINAACAGFVYGLYIANAFITAGQNEKVLVISAEVLSKITDYTDRNTCILFGDGAAAMLVERDEENPGFFSCFYGADGTLATKLYCTNLSPHFKGTKLEKQRFLWQDGRAVYSYIIKTIPRGMKELLKRAGMSKDDLNWFVPHSANMRMIQSICEKMHFPMQKTLTSLEQLGNTSSTSIPLAIWLAEKQGKLKKGDKLALYGFGGGLNHAGIIIEW